jgi:hypothetical protein
MPMSPYLHFRCVRLIKASVNNTTHATNCSKRLFDRRLPIQTRQSRHCFAAEEAPYACPDGSVYLYRICDAKLRSYHCTATFNAMLLCLPKQNRPRTTYDAVESASALIFTVLVAEVHVLGSASSRTPTCGTPRLWPSRD